MNILGCLDTPSSGQYFFNGSDVSKLSEDELADVRKDKIGFVFQSFNLLRRTSVLRNIIMPLTYARIPKEARQEIAKKCLLSAGLNEARFHHLSNQLSGGEMQRVAIARALVNNPSLILADEPTGNLDSKTGEIVLGTFRELNKQGKTVILITHEKYIAAKADRVIAIKDGLIFEDALSSSSKMAEFTRE
jgi:putative ABC transport system ATP-binding protein